jgi:hypothetical protein
MRKKKEYDFVVTLKHPDYKLYNIISSLMSVMAVLASGFGLSHSSFTSSAWIAVALMIFIIAYLIFAEQYKKKDYVVTYKWALLAGAILWFVQPLTSFFIAFFYLIAAILERQIKFPQEIGFDKEGATFNTFPFKHHVWEEIANVILKDNILTIDFKNNKIFQKETETEVTPTVEAEFNEFCNLNLAHGLLHISEA